MSNSQLTELEEDIQQQLATTEKRVRDEVGVTPSRVAQIFIGSFIPHHKLSVHAVFN